MQISNSDTKKKSAMARKIPRPINCFMAFRLEKYPQIVSQSPELNHRDISKVISKWWKEASEATRAPYYRIAAKAKEDHKIMYPGYRYAPVKRSERQIRPYIRKQDPATLRQKHRARNETMKKWLDDSEETKSDDSHHFYCSSSALSSPASLSCGSSVSSVSSGSPHSSDLSCIFQTPLDFDLPSPMLPLGHSQLFFSEPIFHTWSEFTNIPPTSMNFDLPCIDDYSSFSNPEYLLPEYIHPSALSLDYPHML